MLPLAAVQGYVFLHLFAIYEMQPVYINSYRQCLYRLLQFNIQTDLCYLDADKLYEEFRYSG